MYPRLAASPLPPDSRARIRLACMEVLYAPIPPAPANTVRGKVALRRGVQPRPQPRRLEDLRMNPRSRRQVPSLGGARGPRRGWSVSGTAERLFLPEVGTLNSVTVGSRR